MSRVLIIGDLHEPVSHPNYLSFCQMLKDRWKCDTTVFIGDIIDWHGISFHVKHPECPGPRDEYELALSKVQKWHDAFPHAYVCIGNHDCRPERLAESVSIPASLLKSYNDTWETHGWEWDYDFSIDNVYYFHGTGYGGIHPAWNVSGKMLCSVVMGHCHARAGLKWRVNPHTRIFAMDVGCGIDVRAWQFAYGKHVKERPVLAAGVVIDGIPYHEIMPISKGEVYAKERLVEKKGELK